MPAHIAPERRPTAPITAAAMAVAVAFIVIVGCRKAPHPAGEPETNPPATPALSSTPPEEPTFDTREQGDVDADRPFFNDFSWRDFIALNWPATAKRGVADTTKRFGDPAERVVWESWKSIDELFPRNPTTTPPTEWESYKTTLSLQWLDREKKLQQYEIKHGRTEQEAGKVKLLRQLVRMEDINQVAGPGIKVGPLIAQNKTYVRFETRLNKVAYNYVFCGKYYITENQASLPNGLDFPPQSIHVKAAWMELPDEAARRRFYHTTATVVVDWVEGQPMTDDRIVGLVGLHIVHRTPGRMDWIWSTFEHVDNLLCEHGPGTPPASFSSQDPAATTGHNQPPLPLNPPDPYPPISARTPVEVVRLPPDAIHSATKAVNRRYQSHPQVKGTVWENYQLVGTQWPKLGLPTVPPPRGKGDSANRLPSKLANVTMETYTSFFSCLDCHSNASPTSLVFFPQIHAVSVPQPKKGP